MKAKQNLCLTEKTPLLSKTPLLFIFLYPFQNCYSSPSSSSWLHPLFPPPFFLASPRIPYNASTIKLRSPFLLLTSHTHGGFACISSSIFDFASLSSSSQMPSWRKKSKLLSLKGHPWRQFKLFFFVCFFFLTLNPLQPTRVTRQPFNPKPDLPGCINGRRRSWYSCLRFASVWGFWARTARTRPMLTLCVIKPH